VCARTGAEYILLLIKRLLTLDSGTGTGLSPQTTGYKS
jgi:hypothetical protein